MDAHQEFHKRSVVGRIKDQGRLRAGAKPIFQVAKDDVGFKETESLVGHESWDLLEWIDCLEDAFVQFMMADQLPLHVLLEIALETKPYSNSRRIVTV